MRAQARVAAISAGVMPAAGSWSRAGRAGGGAGDGGGIVCGWAVLEDAGQQLDGDEQREGRPAGDDPADGAGVGVGDVGGQAGGGADY